ncbi:MAG: class I SAM-dependent methyltransferase [Candidatus Lokiarchaeia archaeon]
MIMDTELQAFAAKLTKKIIPEVEGIVEAYKRDPDEGLSAYLDFVKRVRPSLERIVIGFRDPGSVGFISPRLLRDPLSLELKTHRRSSEEEEAHILGTLKAILQLIYCAAKGLEPWQFSDTSLHEESLKTQNVGKFDILRSLGQIVKEEIGEVDSVEQVKVVINERRSMKEKRLIDVNRTQTHIHKGQNLDDKNVAVPFTARLMAHYRAIESKSDHPLIVDPFAERLAGDLTSYFDNHRRYTEMDYPLVRSYYIEKNLLTPWCNTIAKSQIVLLGAGLDTRAYRFKPLQTNTHTIFEVDFPIMNRYKEEILQDEQPLCGLLRVSADLSDLDWVSHLIKSGFSSDTPTFWVLEGLAYYMEQEAVASLLAKAAEISSENSQIFVDICVPILAEVQVSPFTKYFKWGLDKEAAPSFFARAGWNVSCYWADDYDQGRDVGQKGLIFVHGVRAIMA